MKYSIKLQIFTCAILVRTLISHCNARSSGDVKTSVETILQAKCILVERCCANTTLEKDPLPNVAAKWYVVENEEVLLPGEWTRNFCELLEYCCGDEEDEKECAGDVAVDAVGAMNCARGDVVLVEIVDNVDKVDDSVVALNPFNC